MSEQYIKINNKNKRRRVIYSNLPIGGHPKRKGFYIVSKAFVKDSVTNPKAKLSIKRGDTVMVISGDDKGKTGKILAVFPREGKVIVESVNMIHRHQKPKRVGQAGEIIEKEAPIFASKVMLYDATKKRPSRSGHKILKDGKKVRIFKISGEPID
ncbi:MAG: 50S ribosomal protein L24 [Candidatus Melainabacteria bacterium]|nr:50S ribosomal protein L24 [Candidatus Melainabacteria bacterium]